MNFLLSAFLIILLLSPGLIFRIAYLNVDHGSKSFQSTFIEEMVFSLPSTLFIHFIWYAATNVFFDIKVNLIYLALINSDKIDTSLSNRDVIEFAAYLLSMYFSAYLLGLLLRIIAEWRNWDINYPLFRLYNEWYYTLRGTFTGNNRRRQFIRSDEVWLDVLVSTKEVDYLYTGLLHSFVLSKESGLNRIFLSSVRRRKLSQSSTSEEEVEIKDLSTIGEAEIDLNNSKDENNEKLNKYIDNRYYEMPGDLFMIPYSEIKNINITHYLLQEVNP